MARVGLKTLERFYAPDILFRNTYRWIPGTNSKHRRDNEKKRVYEVFSWLDLLNEIFRLDLEITVWDTGVEAYKENEKVFEFTYSESARHVYKHQNVMKLAKILSRIEVDEYLLNFLKLAIVYMPMTGRRMERHRKHKEIVKSLLGESLEKVKEVLKNQKKRH